MKHALMLSAGLVIGLAACSQKTEPAPVEAPAPAAAAPAHQGAPPQAPPGPRN
ncbi:hypothetical protein [Brevundimonas sp.]|uniref:hypothetical protein n=1 Tax=Brevundimonas sp. TaxID=1871086 RepID=UPI0025C268EA|nr:hypothetical protein [Brevundimonas sp.]MCG2662709.1 hypothetical protein [Brevundimonas sp.]